MSPSLVKWIPRCSCIARSLFFTIGLCTIQTTYDHQAVCLNRAKYLHYTLCRCLRENIKVHLIFYFTFFLLENYYFIQCQFTGKNNLYDWIFIFIDFWKNIYNYLHIYVHMTINQLPVINENYSLSRKNTVIRHSVWSYEHISSYLTISRMTMFDRYFAWAWLILIMYNNIWHW